MFECVPKEHHKHPRFWTIGELFEAKSKLDVLMKRSDLTDCEIRYMGILQDTLNYNRSVALRLLRLTGDIK